MWSSFPASPKGETQPGAVRPRAMPQVGHRPERGVIEPGTGNSLLLLPLLRQQPVHEVLLADLVHGDTVVTDESPFGVPAASRWGAADLRVESEGQGGDRDRSQDSTAGAGAQGSTIPTSENNQPVCFLGVTLCPCSWHFILSSRAGFLPPQCVWLWLLGREGSGGPLIPKN